MHPVFSFVPNSSYKAYVKGDLPTLDELLCALIVDPLEAEDAAEQFGEKRTPHSLGDFARISHGALRQALETIAQWVLWMRDNHRKGADFAIKSITRYSIRLGAWCAAQVARSVLSYLDNPSKAEEAIKYTEQWVMYQAYIDYVYVAGYAADSLARELSYEGDESAAFAMYSAAEAAFVVGNSSPMQSAVGSVYAAASSKAFENASDLNLDYDDLVNKEMLRLSNVVAEACVSFPVIPW
jgi:hypothetical protein